jgi:hypothetical protein
MFHGGAGAMSLHLFESPQQNTLILSLGAFLVVILGYAVYQVAISPLAKIPGPFWASLTPFWKLYAFSQGDFHERILALHGKYGKFVRIAPTEVIISDGSAIREIYSTTNGRDYLKVCCRTESN